MAKRWPVALIVVGALAPAGALAQSGWVDPPRAEPPAPAAPAPAPAPAPRNVEIQPQAAPPPPPARAETPPPAPPPARAETPPPAPPPARAETPQAPPPPVRQASPPRPAPPPPEVATRPEPEPEPPRRQARPEAVEPAERPPAPRPAPREPSVAERPAPERPAANLGRAAQRLALDYLDFWSASNAEALESVPDFYASRVEFHGRSMSARALFEEKRRFVRRWPERSYNPRSDSMRVSCAPAAEVCTVRTLFDFQASNPQTGRRSAGTGQLELVVALAGSAPVIVSETSSVMQRGQMVPETDED